MVMRPAYVDSRPHGLCRQHHLVGLVDHGVALDSAEKEVLIVVFGLADGLGMGGKIADCVDEPVAIFAHVQQIRRVKVAALQIIQHPQVVFSAGCRTGLH